VLVNRALFLLNAALVIAILHLTSQEYLPSFVKMLPTYLKDPNMGQYGAKKNILSQLEIKPRFLYIPAHVLVAILNEFK
jgi:hypothetical protein